MKHTVGVKSCRLPLQSAGKNALCTLAVGPEVSIAVPCIALISKRLVPIRIKESVPDSFRSVGGILIRAVNICWSFQLRQFIIERGRIGAKERNHSMVTVAPKTFNHINSCIKISRIIVTWPVRLIPRIEERLILKFAVADNDIFILCDGFGDRLTVVISLDRNHKHTASCICHEKFGSLCIVINKVSRDLIRIHAVFKKEIVPAGKDFLGKLSVFVNHLAVFNPDTRKLEKTGGCIISRSRIVKSAEISRKMPFGKSKIPDSCRNFSCVDNPVCIRQRDGCGIVTGSLILRWFQLNIEHIIFVLDGLNSLACIRDKCFGKLVWSEAFGIHIDLIIDLCRKLLAVCIQKRWNGNIEQSSACSSFVKIDLKAFVFILSKVNYPAAVIARKPLPFDMVWVCTVP